MPLHVSNSHAKFGWISSNGLGGDSLTDGRTEAILKSMGIMSMDYKRKSITIIHKRLKKLTVPDLRSIWTLIARCQQEKEVGQEIKHISLAILA